MGPVGRSKPVEPPAAPLTDGVVAVRQRRDSDVDAIAAASHDPDTLRWLDDPAMDEDARRTSMARVEQAWTTGSAAPFVIADSASDEAVGLINVRFDDDEPATVAYSVLPAWRGRGIAPRAGDSARAPRSTRGAPSGRSSCSAFGARSHRRYRPHRGVGHQRRDDEVHHRTKP
jgi:hypothetical protein